LHQHLDFTDTHDQYLQGVKNKNGKKSSAVWGHLQAIREAKRLGLLKTAQKKIEELPRMMDKNRRPDDISLQILFLALAEKPMSKSPKNLVCAKAGPWQMGPSLHKNRRDVGQKKSVTVEAKSILDGVH